MPRTIQPNEPLVIAAVFDYAGHAIASRPFSTRVAADKWIDDKLHMYGSLIVAHDVFENAIELDIQ